MENSLGFITLNVYALVLMLVIDIIFFLKPRQHKTEDQVYSSIILVMTFTIITGIILGLFVDPKLNINTFFLSLINKAYLMFLFLWVLLFTLYIYYVARCLSKNITKFSNRVVKIVKYYVFVTALLVFILPINIEWSDHGVVAMGPSVITIYALVFLNIVFQTICLISDFKHWKSKKYIPLYLLVVFGTIIAIIQAIYPALNYLINPTLALIVMTMYFTIENPDLKMVNELYKNKSIMEQTYEDKSNFLFEITQALKEPMLNIKNACDESSKQTKVADLKESLYKIKGYSKEMDFVLNEILNTGGVTSNSVKFIDNKYNIERLYDEIVSRINPVIPKNVKFSSSIAHNIPTLYGDSIKIKQVVMSLLQNSVKHTTNGFIDFQIDTIERFDAIRLIIVIRDSSEGMSIDKINEVLTMSGDLDVRDIEALEQSNISMKLCQKVVKLLGGNMLIKSYDGKGSEILLVIDQKIADTKSNVVEAYESYTSINKTVCVVNQDKQYDNILRTTLKKNHISTSFLLNGNDLIDKIKSGKKYDYIIVGNEMKGINGLSILQELKTIKGFKTPVIIIINEEEERIAKHFLEEGFANYIITNNFAEDLNTIINKY